MNSVMLKMAAQVLKFLFLGISVWLLLRGHNYPGGGFIGGLIAGLGLIVIRLAFETDYLPAESDKNENVFFVAGMISVFVSMITGMVIQNVMLEGIWLKINISGFQEPLKLGTPLLFDVGVYLTVIGFIFLIYRTIMEEWLWK